MKISYKFQDNNLPFTIVINRTTTFTFAMMMMMMMNDGSEIKMDSIFFSVDENDDGKQERGEFKSIYIIQ